MELLQGLRRMATEKVEKESLRFRSEIQMLREQLELSLRLNSGDFPSEIYDA